MKFSAGIAMVVLLTGIAFAQSSEIRMVRSLSGPNGKVAGNQFVFDETRSKFTYPQDKKLVVYFEWDAPPGNYVLSAIWKYPDGRPATLSQDVTVQTTNRELRTFWEFDLVPTMTSGIWTLDVRVNGQPGGSHPFEVNVPEVPAAVTAAPPPPPTLDEIYRKTLQSLVWIYRLDRTGRRIDLGTGFIDGKDRIVTAFQNIDGADDLEIEFADGRIVRTPDILNHSRTQDWAVLRADTETAPALEREPTDTGLVGTRLIAMTAQSDKTRLIGGIDVSGRQDMAGFPGRIQITPALTPESAGNPLLSIHGRVVGVFGASVTPGARFERRVTAIGTISAGVFSVVSAATPVRLIPQSIPGTPKTLKGLADAGVLTAAVSPSASFSYGGVTNNVQKDASKPMGADVYEFSRRDPLVWIYSWWQKREKTGKGTVSINVYDAQNQLRLKGTPIKANLQENAPTRFTLNFAPTSLDRGIYRVDVLWDTQVVWRTFFTMVD